MFIVNGCIVYVVYYNILLVNFVFLKGKFYMFGDNELVIVLLEVLVKYF